MVRKKRKLSEAQIAFQAKKIKVLVKENPKRKGTASHKRFKLYRRCKSIGGFLKAGGRRLDLFWDKGRDFIKF